MIGVGVAAALVLGGDALLDATNKLDVAERKSSRADAGGYGIGLLITTGGKMDGIGSVVTEEFVAESTSTPARSSLLFSGEEVRVFVATTEEFMPTVLANLGGVPVAGSLTFTSVRDDMEARLVKLMEEQGIKEYRIIHD